MNEERKYTEIPKSKFRFVDSSDIYHDKKIETKPVGYFQDALRRFSKNKASVVAAYIILFLVLYAIIGPFCFNQGYQDAYATDNQLIYYKELLPRISWLDGTGVWDGTKKVEVSQYTYDVYRGIGIETGHDPIVEVYDEFETEDIFHEKSKMYTIRVNTYYMVKAITLTLTYDQYKALQDWQDENNIQLILPRVKNQANATNPNIWYKSDQKGNAEKDINGNFVPAYYTDGPDDYTSEMRLEGDPGNWKYAQRTGQSGKYNYVVRVSAYDYFVYKYGFEPCFTFGTDTNGYDIFSRLASGARFSLLLAVFVSIINLTLGAIYGAIEGYYGGATDMVMERISDILANVPFTIVTVLFKLHLAPIIGKGALGIVVSLLLSFVVTGWIGMASRVRMQFYRFKNQEYVLAARTLGARDRRIMFKHIFPNSLGTIITGSVLVIPGVIFSETSLSYLGIIQLDTSTMSSVGAMLSAGQNVMTSSPHVVLFPCIFIALLMICFNLFGNGLRDAFNPSLRGSED